MDKEIRVSITPGTVIATLFIIVGAISNNVSNNFINTSGSSVNYGIYLYSNTNNNTITANNVRTGGIGSYNDGIALSLNIIGNNITHNLINTSGTTDNKGISLSSIFFISL